MPTYPYQFRRDTLANWKSANPVLREGEMGLELPGVVGDDGVRMFKIKIGDGATAWNALPYASGPAGPSPEYQWSGTSLRFMNPNGTWGSYVNLQGPRGAKGEKGDPGPAGTSTPATTTKIGGVIIGDGIDVTPEGCISVDSIPKGTKMIFNQAAAPTGWTKQTAVNDAALRVVSGTTGGDTGGSLAFSTLFATGKAVTLSGNVGATTLTANQGPLHDHEMAGNTGVEDPTMYRFYANFSPGAPKRGSEDNKYPFTNLSVLSSGGSTSHAHTLSGSAKIALNVKYTDVIICAKA